MILFHQGALVLACLQRNKVRKTNGIAGSELGDCVVAYCCLPCAIVQMKKEVGALPSVQWRDDSFCLPIYKHDMFVRSISSESDCRTAQGGEIIFDWLLKFLLQVIENIWMSRFKWVLVECRFRQAALRIHRRTTLRAGTRHIRSASWCLWSIRPWSQESSLFCNSWRWTRREGTFSFSVCSRGRCWSRRSPRAPNIPCIRSAGRYDRVKSIASKQLKHRETCPTGPAHLECHGLKH